MRVSHPAQRLRAGAEPAQLRGIPSDERGGSRHVGPGAQPIRLCGKLQTSAKGAHARLSGQDREQDDRPGGHEQPQREHRQSRGDGQTKDRHNDAYLREDEILEILHRRREDVGAGPSAQSCGGERDERLVCRDPSPREQVQGGVV